MRALTHLGDANAPDLDDGDSDGIRNLAEYGLNLLPETPDAAPLAVTRFIYAEGERMRMFIQREPAHNDVTIEVRAADSPAGPWTVIATSTLGAPFTSARRSLTPRSLAGSGRAADAQPRRRRGLRSRARLGRSG